ncbi:HPr family phosphocarrier protein [Haloarcula amylovorans]|uniref:HPr family phosphocarrier protein n=1 Tax=Haloarcula amylovorans TaxID=2562280 RepID=UPI00107612EA|nr:HPr family phosphocarrier protein [Halomicroarcula amylolytica]
MEKTVTLTHEKGLHARPASVFVQSASEYDASIEIHADGATANAKSSVAILSLNAEEGDEITITADGDDEDAAVERLATLVRDDFELESEA